MMRWIPPLIAALLALFSLIGGAAPSPDEKPAAKAPAKSIYRNADLGIALRPPQFDAPGAKQMVAPVIFSAPAQDGFAANLSVAVQPKLSKEEFASITRTQFNAMGLKVVSESDRKIDGLEGLEWVYESEQGGRKLTHIAVALIGENRSYLMTGTALRDGFAKVEPAFRAAIESFQAKEPE